MCRLATLLKVNKPKLWPLVFFIFTESATDVAPESYHMKADNAKKTLAKFNFRQGFYC
jgi:hypothetical protein